MSYITDITGSEMIEATRLTREGRLAEATALLQRLLRAARQRQTRQTTHRAIPRERHMSLRRIS